MNPRRNAVAIFGDRAYDRKSTYGLVIERGGKNQEFAGMFKLVLPTQYPGGGADYAVEKVSLKFQRKPITGSRNPGVRSLDKVIKGLWIEKSKDRDRTTPTH